MNKKLFEQLYRDEGCKLVPYQCTEGFWTIGVGRNLETNGLSTQEQELFFGNTMSSTEVINSLKERGISKREAHLMLLDDLFSTLYSLSTRLSFADHIDARVAVFINMAYQMGVSGLFKFKRTLAYFNAKDYEACAKELLDSVWAIQTPERAARLSIQMATGEWQ